MVHERKGDFSVWRWNASVVADIFVLGIAAIRDLLGDAGLGQPRTVTESDGDVTQLGRFSVVGIYFRNGRGYNARAWNNSEGRIPREIEAHR